MKYLVGLCLCLCALFFSCSGAKKRGQALHEWLQPNGKVKVLCTTEMIADVVRSIGGEQIDSLTLITGELDPHSYELVKGDAEKFDRADVIFYTGLGLEHGASVYSKLKGHTHGVAVADVLKEKEAQLITIDGQIDPHVWMDLMLWIQIVDPIVDALGKIDADHAGLFIQRGEVLKEVFRKNDGKISRLLGSIPKERRYVVTTHDAFNYFTRRYLSSEEEVENGSWKTRCSAPEGLAPESQMSMQDIISISEYLVEHKIPVVFPESNLSPDSLRKVVSVCQDKGFRILICTKPLYGDSMGSAKDGSDTYFGMMQTNAKTIHEYLMAGEQ